MYYFYYTMGRILRENIVSKMGDLNACRGHHVNLVYYCHPDRQRKIDVCDYIYCEMVRAAEERMTPKYSAILQRFLNAVVPRELMKGQRVVQELLSVSLRGQWSEVPSMMGPDPPARSGSSGGRGGSRARRGSGSSSRPSRGAARFFKAMWDMCKSTYDVSHKAIQMSQETR
jgi:hypothetical protein